MNKPGTFQTVDREFGGKPEGILRTFQKKADLKQDGLYGNKVHKSLMDAVAANDVSPGPEPHPLSG